MTNSKEIVFYVSEDLIIKKTYKIYDDFSILFREYNLENDNNEMMYVLKNEIVVSILSTEFCDLIDWLYNFIH